MTKIEFVLDYRSLVLTICVSDLYFSGPNSSLTLSVVEPSCEAGKLFWNIRTQLGHQGKTLHPLEDIVVYDLEILRDLRLDGPSARDIANGDGVAVVCEIISCRQVATQLRERWSTVSLLTFHGLIHSSSNGEKFTGTEIELLQGCFETDRMDFHCKRILYSSQLEHDGRVIVPLLN